MGKRDDLFKPGNYRTSNHGDMWSHVIENMPDGSGRVVARCDREEDAERIVREHNAFGTLKGIVGSLLLYGDGRTWDLNYLRAVLAQAEGKSHE